MSSVIRSIEIQASPSAVWRWMATPDALRHWLGSSLEIDLQVGGAYRLCEDGVHVISGNVLELVPEDRLILSWLEEGGDWVHPARLVVSLTPTSAGTRVTLAHDGFAGIGKASWPATVQAYERGIDEHRLLERLAELVTADRTVTANAA